jgi:outer membrane protein OmpA-like peptidoglycan-associated protein
MASSRPKHRRMSQKQVGRAVLCLSVAVASPVWAQTAGVEAGASTDTGASTGASTSTGVSTDASASTSSGATTSATARQEAPATEFEPYEAGYPPEHNLLEIGVFGGAFFPSSKHNLRNENFRQHPYGIGPEFGARLGYYPLSFLGIEGEAIGVLTRNKDNDSRAMLFGGRGSLVLQIPTGYVTPFVLGGVGKLAASSHNQGYDADVAWHFGVGAKIPITHLVSLRIDGRDNLTPKTGDDRNAQTHSFEALIGLTAVIERTRKEPPPPPADTDHDGVIDREDQCPAETGVAPNGCPADTDNDGVLDRDDYCPKEAGKAPKGCPIIDFDPDKDGVPMPCDQCPDEAGVRPDGCPVRDTDGDGIFDDKDKCPKEPETKNGFEDSDGCPDKLPEKFKKFTGVVQGIFFDQGKSTIRKESNATLDGAVKVLQEFPSVKLEISGHTSSEGSKEVNAKLSQERADAVKTWLVGKGVDPNRIQTRGAGSDEPIADNKTALGRSKNRRIEFKILQ